MWNAELFHREIFAYSMEKKPFSITNYFMSDIQKNTKKNTPNFVLWGQGWSMYNERIVSRITNYFMGYIFETLKTNNVIWRSLSSWLEYGGEEREADKRSWGEQTFNFVEI